MSAIGPLRGSFRAVTTKTAPVLQKGLSQVTQTDTSQTLGQTLRRSFSQSTSRSGAHMRQTYNQNLLRFLKVGAGVTGVGLTANAFGISPTRYGSQAFRDTVGVTTPIPDDNPGLAATCPTSSKAITSLDITGKTEMANGILGQIKAKTQVMTNTLSDGSHQYSHIGGAQDLSKDGMATLKNLYEKGTTTEIGQMFLAGFPGFAKNIEPIPGSADSYKVTLTDGAVIKAKIQKIPMRDDCFALGLEAQTTPKHSLRGVAQWMLIADPAQNKVSFSVVGAGKHPVSVMDKLNNTLIRCGFWNATGEGVVAGIEKKAVQDSRLHMMFKMMGLPNTVLGRLNAYIPANPDDVAQ